MKLKHIFFPQREPRKAVYTALRAADMRFRFCERKGDRSLETAPGIHQYLQGGFKVIMQAFINFPFPETP